VSKTEINFEVLSMSDLVSQKVNALPAITTGTDDLLGQITGALGVGREVLPSKDQIDTAWGNLPRLLSKIPAEL